MLFVRFRMVFRRRQLAGAVLGQIAPSSEHVDSDDSEDGTDEEFADESEDRVDVQGCMETAHRDRVLPITRRGYQGYLRKMAVWAKGLRQFKGCVSASGEMKTPLEPDAMIGFTEYLKECQVNWPHHPTKGTKKHMSPKTICNFFAAAKDTYARHGQPFPDHVYTYFSDFYRSYVLFIAELKNKGAYPDSTNSVGFSFGVYERICQKACGYIQSAKGACMTSWRYVWLFFVFLFNLMGRRERISRLRYSWIWWQDDSMLVKVPTQKGDQEGNLSYWKRLYANSEKPWLCCVTALGVEVLSTTPAEEFRDLVFKSSGGASHTHFQTFLRWAFQNETLDGVPIHRITGHSPKRSAICLVSGCEAVKWDQVELRADHKLGLTSVYQTSAAPQQDGIMGRLLAGLPFGEKSFNIAPPHFETEVIARIPFREFIAHYESYDPQFQSVIPFLLASVVFHLNSGQLSKMLPAFHPFWSSTFFLRHKKLLKSLQDKVLGGKPGVKCALKVTGNSVVGDIRIDVSAVLDDVAHIRADVAVIRAGSSISTNQNADSSSVLGDKRSLELELAEIKEDLRFVRQRLEQQDTNRHAAVVHAGHGAMRCVVPVFYLANSFVLPSYTPFNLFTRWFSPDPPTPALRHIKNEMLPRVAGRRLQENLLSTYHKFMEVFLGRNPDIAAIEMDLTTAFTAAWARLDRACSWSNERSADRSVKTVYGWLLKQPDVLKLLKDDKVPFANPGSAVADVVLRQEIMEMLDRRDAAGVLTLHPPPPSPQAYDLSAFKTCMPRLAMLYPQDAPRPRNPLRTNETTTPQHEFVEDYIRSNAPRVGARPCWSCPFCVSFAFFERKFNFFRHVREKHKERTLDPVARSHYYDNADDVVLVWCSQSMKGGQRSGTWEALRGLQ